MDNSRFKFRAWDIHAKCMVNPESFVVTGNGELGLVHEGDYSFTTITDWPVMQYTGLKDKNGKEIYEGDICKAPHDFGPGGFSERVFSVRWHNERGYQWQYWLLSELEVIGNIHENPELLDG